MDMAWLFNELVNHGESSFPFLNSERWSTKWLHFILSYMPANEFSVMKLISFSDRQQMHATKQHQNKNVEFSLEYLQQQCKKPLRKHHHLWVFLLTRINMHRALGGEEDGFVRGPRRRCPPPDSPPSLLSLENIESSLLLSPCMKPSGSESDSPWTLLWLTESAGPCWCRVQVGCELDWKDE